MILALQLRCRSSLMACCPIMPAPYTHHQGVIRGQMFHHRVQGRGLTSRSNTAGFIGKLFRQAHQLAGMCRVMNWANPAAGVAGTSLESRPGPLVPG